MIINVHEILFLIGSMVLVWVFFVGKVRLIFLVLILLLLFLFYLIGLEFLLNFLLLLVFVGALIVGLNSRRNFIYKLALVFLVCVPFILILKMEKLAELFAIYAYLLLVMGVLKDLFYGRIYES